MTPPSPSATSHLRPGAEVVRPRDHLVWLLELPKVGLGDRRTQEPPPPPPGGKFHSLTEDGNEALPGVMAAPSKWHDAFQGIRVYHAWSGLYK